MSPIVQSRKSRVINALIRHRHLFRGRLRREEFTMESSIAAFREQCEQSAARLSRLPPDVRVKPEDVGGIPIEWLRPSGAPEGKTILYVHGGGYVSGSCADHRGFVASFAKNWDTRRLPMITGSPRNTPIRPPSRIRSPCTAVCWIAFSPQTS